VGEQHPAESRGGRPKTPMELLRRYRAGERDFGYVVLVKATLGGANLAGADLRGADLRWANLIRANLSGANLTKANLSGAKLYAADLRKATLLEADLSWANPGGANLSNADLGRADLRGVKLYGAKLRGTNLGGAQLTEADLSRADLRGTNLGGATLGWAVLGNLDLSGALGLDYVNHVGPSTVGIDTIYRSRGKISRRFLEGCGVQRTLIDNMSSLVGRAIESSACFISHGLEDRKFVGLLRARMAEQGFRVWSTPRGQAIDERIDRVVRPYDKLLLVLSRDSLNTYWVQTEIYKATQREKNEARRLLHPVSLVPNEELAAWQCRDADTGKDFASEIRQRTVLDFSSWRNLEALERGLERLSEDLRKDEAAPASPEQG
jgi:uncharacterized protein YjbI with pentapeptide repeats